jgi:hypothetical protein
MLTIQRTRKTISWRVIRVSRFLEAGGYHDAFREAFSGAADSRWNGFVLAADLSLSCVQCVEVTGRGERNSVKIVASGATGGELPFGNVELVAAVMRRTKPQVPILMLSGWMSPPKSLLHRVLG